MLSIFYKNISKGKNMRTHYTTEVVHKNRIQGVLDYQNGDMFQNELGNGCKNRKNNFKREQYRQKKRRDWYK